MKILKMFLKVFSVLTLGIALCIGLLVGCVELGEYFFGRTGGIVSGFLVCIAGLSAGITASLRNTES